MNAKYHSSGTRKSDVKTALYFHSRFNDLRDRMQSKHKGKEFTGILATNTRFTSDASDYGNCSGLKLISWDRPHGESLKDRVSRSGLHPITCMTTITKKEKQKLIDENIVLSRDLSDNLQILEKWGISESRRQKIADEARELCNVWETN